MVAVKFNLYFESVCIFVFPFTFSNSLFPLFFLFVLKFFLCFNLKQTNSYPNQKFHIWDIRLTNLFILVKNIRLLNLQRLTQKVFFVFFVFSFVFIFFFSLFFPLYPFFSEFSFNSFLVFLTKLFHRGRGFSNFFSLFPSSLQNDFSSPLINELIICVCYSSISIPTSPSASPATSLSLDGPPPVPARSSSPSSSFVSGSPPATFLSPKKDLLSRQRPLSPGKESPPSLITPPLSLPQRGRKGTFPVSPPPRPIRSSLGNTHRQMLSIQTLLLFLLLLLLGVHLDLLFLVPRPQAPFLPLLRFLILPPNLLFLLPSLLLQQL